VRAVGRVVRLRSRRRPSEARQGMRMQCKGGVSSTRDA
jgi:hypothetical protein